MRDQSRTARGTVALEDHGESARARVALLEQRAARRHVDDPVDAAMTVAAAMDLRRRGDDAIRIARIRGRHPDVVAATVLQRRLDAAIDRYASVTRVDVPRSDTHRAVAHACFRLRQDPDF